MKVKIKLEKTIHILSEPWLLLYHTIESTKLSLKNTKTGQIICKFYDTGIRPKLRPLLFRRKRQDIRQGISSIARSEKKYYNKVNSPAERI